VRIRGIGITSMGETGVLVDGARRPVAASIAWHDQRDAAEVDLLGHDLPDFPRRAGKPMRGQWSLTKHRWLTTHLPASRHAVRRFNVAEWVAVGLGADEACDRTLACRTGWFDLFRDTWWPEALDWSGAAQSLMPPLVRSGEPIGTVVAGAMQGAVITLAGHDHQAAAVGAGAEAPGDEFDSCGTAEALVRTVLPTLADSDVDFLAARGITTDLSVHRDRWSLLGGTEGGLALQRTLARLHLDERDLPRLDELARSGDSGPGRLWREAVAATTQQAAELHDAMRQAVGPPQRLIAAGGWCRSTAVMAAKREAFGDLAVSPVAECGTFGAAILAARAAGSIGPGDRLGGPR
jgi:sugar (pentulose or hexulose) kinase